MKKVLFSIAAAVLMLSSCVKEDFGTQATAGEEVTVTFNAALPEAIATKAYSDGTTAKKLHYGVYVSGTDKRLFGEGDVKTFDNLQTSVELTLASGVTYDIIFWAQSEDAAAYSIDWTAKTMTVDYENINANDENNDAFYAYIGGLKIEGALNKTVELYRPFAQINLGTDDYKKAVAAGLEVDRTNMVAKLPTVLNFVDGTVATEKKTTFTVNTIGKNETYPVAGYEYLEMNYILVGAEQSMTDITFNVWEKDADASLTPNIYVSNVPVQRNYRTNIYGSLLTDPANITVVIKPAYEEPDNNHDLVNVSTAAELANALNNGESVKLMNDLDIEAPIVMKRKVTAILDLNGKTIRNTKNFWFDNAFAAVDCDWSLVSVADGTLIIKNGTLEGTNCYAIDVKANYWGENVGGKVIIESGKFIGNTSAVYVYEGEAVINGGSFENNDGSGNSDFLINLYDENRQKGIAKAAVTGGTFVDFNPENNRAEGEGSNFVAEGYEAVKEGNTYEVMVKISVDLGTSVKWANGVYGATEDNPHGTYLTVEEAATAIKGYRLPTEAEAEELVSCCTWTKAEVNGVEGYYVQSKVSENSIFLPTLPDDFHVEALRGKMYYFTETPVLGAPAPSYAGITDLGGYIEVACYWVGNKLAVPLLVKKLETE